MYSLILYEQEVKTIFLPVTLTKIVLLVESVATLILQIHSPSWNCVRLFTTHVLVNIVSLTSNVLEQVDLFGPIQVNTGSSFSDTMASQNREMLSPNDLIWGCSDTLTRETNLIIFGN